MNVFKRIWGRIYQCVLFIFSKLIKFRKPIILDSTSKLIDEIEKNNFKNILLITGKRVSQSKSYIDLKSVLSKYNLFTFEEMIPEPDITDIEKVIEDVKDKAINMVIGFGGGSVMDSSKIISARLANPKRSIEQMRGVMHVGKKIVTLTLIPTTAGTGSEATVAAVVSNHELQQKYAINDPKLIPTYTLFIPEVLYSLPSSLTASTGMDALTHAVEAYIGRSNTLETKTKAVQAIKMIFDNLYLSYTEPENYKARLNMLYASHYAGIAFTKAYVGYVHGLAHALGARYSLGHGVLNATLLPLVLRTYGKSVYRKLARLSILCGVSEAHDTKEEAAIKFIEKIEELNTLMNMPKSYKEIKKDDIPDMINHINKEVYPLYPVPRYLGNDEIKRIYKNIMED